MGSDAQGSQAHSVRQGRSDFRSVLQSGNRVFVRLPRRQCQTGMTNANVHHRTEMFIPTVGPRERKK